MVAKSVGMGGPVWSAKGGRADVSVPAERARFDTHGLEVMGRSPEVLACFGLIGAEEYLRRTNAAAGLTKEKLKRQTEINGRGVRERHEKRRALTRG